MNMRTPSRFSGFFRWLAPLLCVMACVGAAFGQTYPTTTITGTVYAPNGTDPLPNILVYAVAAQLPAFTAFTGPVSCDYQASLVPGSTLGYATTDYSGKFSIITTNVPSGTTSVNLVIQAGKWRRQYPGTAITVGATTAAGTLAMPANATQGDLPNIAVVTGNADAVECVLQSMGISNSEFTDPPPLGNGHINLYPGTGVAGAGISASSQNEAYLMNNKTLLNTYDMVMFGCQGQVADTTVTETGATALNNLLQYTNIGGRVFATHYGFVWLDKAETFMGIADWRGDVTSIDPNGSADGIISINTTGSFPEGVTLANWLQIVNPTDPYGTITEVTDTRQDQTGVVTPTQSWGTLVPPYASGSGTIGTPVMQFTFNTPVGAAGTPTVSISYENPTTPFEQGDSSDTITIDVTNTSSTAADSTLTLTLLLPGGITATNLQGVGPATGWTCSLTALACSRTATGQSLQPGADDQITLTFSIAPTTPVGQVTINASLSGGDLSGNQQCGRVLFNEYHVENPASTKAPLYFPKECQTPPAENGSEKFLEFSLYNLSNFVSPSTADAITIEGVPTLAWNPTPNSIPYGTLLTGYGTGTMLDATATDVDTSSSVAGAFVYTYNGTAVNTTTTLLPAGNDTLLASFTPTVTADYTTPSPYQAIIQVTQDASTTTLTNVVSPIFYGQAIALAALEGAKSNGPANSLDGGTLNFYINTTLACSVPEPAQPACPTTTGTGYDVGNYTVYSMYTGDNNFAASTSASYPVVVNPATTGVALTDSLGTITPGQAITFTATVADTVGGDAAVPYGTVTFMDGSTVLGTGAVTVSQPVAAITVTNLLVGPHNITACYAPGQDTVGTYDFAPSCSPAVLVIVTFPPTTIPTVTLLSSNLNPSVAGQNVTFSVSVATTGAFVSVPIGGVTIYDGSTSLGQATLDANGNATLSTSGLTPGLHNITAAYPGWTNILPSTSVVVAQQVNSSVTSAGNGFMMTVTPTTFSVGSGSSLSVGITILELNNFNQPVQLSCSGLPSEATCTFLTSLMPASGGTTQMIVTPAAPHNCNTTSSPYFVADGEHTGLPLLALAALVFFARRRRLLKGLVLAAAICILPAISGCSGTCTDLGVKPGTYTFTVTGTSTGTPVVVQTQTMTMTVTI